MESQKFFVKRNSIFFSVRVYQRAVLTAVILSVAYLSLPGYSYAASLYFSPASGQEELSSTFTVNVYVSSADQAINAVSGTVSFPADKLQVISLVKTSSIIALWVTDPSFSNIAGTLHFEGVALNPGFTGVNGGVVRITFKAKAVGTASISFLTGQVLANDGLGTNVLNSMGTASFDINAASTPVPGESNIPGGPEVSSPTHPSEGTWYANADPEFTWVPPLDITGVRISYSGTAGDKPDVFYSELSQKRLSNIPDGVWYFHAQYRTTAGWGEISHRRFQIDTTKPEHLSIITYGSSDSSKTKFVMEAVDKTSGINHYEIKIDDGAVVNWPSVTNTTQVTYETIVADSGNHLLTVSAVDKAGNSLSHAFEFTAPNASAPIVQRGFFGLSQGMINLFALLALFVIILEVIVFLFRYIWRKSSRHLKNGVGGKQIKKQKTTSSHEDDHSLNLLRNEMESQVAFLEQTGRKRRLTKEEEKILNRLRKITGVN